MTPVELDRLQALWERAIFPPWSAWSGRDGVAFVRADHAAPHDAMVAGCDGRRGSANAAFIAAAGCALPELLRLARAGLDAEGAGHATWSNGYDEGRRHEHKECRDEIARLRALLAAAGVDAGEQKGSTDAE